jgi:Protein of unknown function DUF72
MKGSHLQETFSFAQRRPGAAVVPPFDADVVAELARAGMRLGTLSWRYRAWEGLLYRGGYANEGEFQREALREYARFLPALGLELTQFSWPSPELVNHLLESTAEDFRFVLRVPRLLTLRQFPPSAVYGRLAGNENPDFLSVALFQERVLRPFERLGARLGALLFEMNSVEPLELEAWGRFFREIPRSHPLAVEFCAPAGIEGWRFVAELDLAPVFTFSGGAIEDQWQAYCAAGGDRSRGPVLLLAALAEGLPQEEARRVFSPFRELLREFPRGLEAAAMLGQASRSAGRDSYFLTGNLLEGSALHSLERIANRLLPLLRQL